MALISLLQLNICYKQNGKHTVGHCCLQLYSITSLSEMVSYYSWAGILLSSASVFHLTFAVEGNCLELSLWQHWRRDDLVLSNDGLEQCPRHTCLGHWLVVVRYCEIAWPSSEKIGIAYSCFVSHLTVLMSFFTIFSWQV